VIKIVVAEPNQMLRMGIRSVLEKNPEYVISDEVVNADQLRATFLEVPHDVVLVELGLLQEIGSTALRELRQARPDSKMLVHSYEIDTDFGANASRFGAIGYLANDCSSSDLCAAVAKVAAGEPYITRTLGEQLAMSVCFRASNLPYAPLNRRELQVFKMLAIGLKASDIATHLGKSVDVIYGYKRQIMAKMNLPDASELVRHAIAQSVLKGLTKPLEIYPRQ
jgi:DNA-binding NarL/FixJ family response regulator